MRKLGEQVRRSGDGGKEGEERWRSEQRDLGEENGEWKMREKTWSR